MQQISRGLDKRKSIIIITIIYCLKLLFFQKRSKGSLISHISHTTGRANLTASDSRQRRLNKQSAERCKETARKNKKHHGVMFFFFVFFR